MQNGEKSVYLQNHTIGEQIRNKMWSISQRASSPTQETPGCTPRVLGRVTIFNRYINVCGRYSRTRPYLSTLQPQLGQVQPPHIASSEVVGLRIVGRCSPQRGQIPTIDPTPHRPFNFDCLRTTTSPIINPATPISMSRVAGSIAILPIACGTRHCAIPGLARRQCRSRAKSAPSSQSELMLTEREWRSNARVSGATQPPNLELPRVMEDPT